jgi:citrate lyase subunit beta / citryl-CoA lyase
VTWAPPGPALLFCPADRPDRFAKAAAAADAVILDLEDGVAPADKEAARKFLRESDLDPSRTIVRVNPSHTADHALDLAAVARTGYEVLMLAKAESPEQVDALAPHPVIALCETPRGVLAAADMAACHTAAGLLWGAEDLVAALGGRASRHDDGTYRDVARQARATILLAAGAHDIPAIDAVYLDIGDLEGLRAEATDAAACGFSATACIHPSQPPVVRQAYQPSEEELTWARRLLAAASGEAGVFSFEGRMVDAPILRHAEHVLDRAGLGS